MNKYICFGAGFLGNQAIEVIGKENIKFFIDNDIEKQKRKFNDFEVLSLENAKKSIGDSTVIIALSVKYQEEVKKQLKDEGIIKFKSISDLKFEYTREKILKRKNYIDVYKKTIKWILKNSIKNEGIINNTNLIKSYPEVTGYYIPTLIRWGYKELAVSYAKWLCNIQHEDGSWYDTFGENPYIFDTAQILKGLISIRNLYPEVDKHIIAGCDWILTNMSDEGRLISPMENAWGDGKTFSELIHTYCISPIKESGIIFNRKDYIDKANKIAEYYTTECKEQILNFDLLSHFYAYVMEAMIDIGRIDLAEEAMDKIALLQKESGAVPAYNNVDWVCSTGLFQLALVWFRLGNIERGNRTFEYACKLQNDTGGWFGSYISEVNSLENNSYFPNSEISWANKYFLDALYYKNLSQFEKMASIFKDKIEKNDGRYQCIENIIKSIKGKSNKILDIGCGKGCYLNNLVVDYPENDYYAADLSLNVMNYLYLDAVTKKQGSLTNIPFDDEYFDIVYTCEALEHAVDIKNAVKELCRVTKSGGKIAVIDKNKDQLGYFDIEEWEQWFDEFELKNELSKYCSSVNVIKNIDFDDKSDTGLFYCWIGIRN